MTLIQTSMLEPHIWSSDALLAKAQRYLEEMHKHTKNEWQFGFWSCLILEMLLRASLAKINPVLLAHPQQWENIYFALGHDPKTKRYIAKSISVAEVIKRLDSILIEFTTDIANFCATHIEKRNFELHSGKAEFDQDDRTWLPRLYITYEMLLTTLGLNLEQFLGREEAKIAIELIQAEKQEIKTEVEKTIREHMEKWRGISEEDRQQLITQASLWATRQAGHRVKCPACQSSALVAGRAVSEPKKKMDGDLIIEKQEYRPDGFECTACGMKLSGVARIAAAGLDSSYTLTSTYDPIEYYDLDEQGSEWEEDFNE